MIALVLRPGEVHVGENRSYRNGVEASPDAMVIFLFLAILGLWYLRRTIRCPPGRTRKAGRGTEERAGPGVQGGRVLPVEGD